MDSNGIPRPDYSSAFEKWAKDILKEQGLNEWTIKFNTGGGLCVRSKKEIWLTSPNDEPFALFLHEVAHALIDEKYDIEMSDKTGHHAIFADKYTSLVKKYMTPAGATWKREQLEAEIDRWTETDNIFIPKDTTKEDSIKIINNHKQAWNACATLMSDKVEELETEITEQHGLIGKMAIEYNEIVNFNKQLQQRLDEAMKIIKVLNDTFPYDEANKFLESITVEPKQEKSCCENCDWFNDDGHPRFSCGFYKEVPTSVKVCNNWKPKIGGIE